MEAVGRTSKTDDIVLQLSKAELSAFDDLGISRTVLYETKTLAPNLNFVGLLKKLQTIPNKNQKIYPLKAPWQLVLFNGERQVLDHLSLLLHWKFLKSTVGHNALHVVAWSANQDGFAFLKSQLSHEEIKQLLHQADNQGLLPLHHLIQLGNIDGLQWIGQQFSNELSSLLSKSVGQTSMNPFHYAAQYGHVKVLEWLKTQLGPFKFLIAKDTNQDKTIYHRAAYSGNVDCLEWIANQLPIGFTSMLLQQKANGNASVFFEAATQGHCDSLVWMATKLGHSLTNEQLNELINHQYPLLHEVAKFGHVDCLEWSSKQLGDDFQKQLLQIQSHGHDNILHIVARTDHIDCLSWITKQLGEETDKLIAQPNKPGFTPLHATFKTLPKLRFTPAFHYLVCHFPSSTREVIESSKTVSGLPPLKQQLEITLLETTRELILNGYDKSIVNMLEVFINDWLRLFAVSDNQYKLFEGTENYPDQATIGQNYQHLVEASKTALQQSEQRGNILKQLKVPQSQVETESTSILAAREQTETIVSTDETDSLQQATQTQVNAQIQVINQLQAEVDRLTSQRNTAIAEKKQLALLSTQKTKAQAQRIEVLETKIKKLNQQLINKHAALATLQEAHSELKTTYSEVFQLSRLHKQELEIVKRKEAAYEKYLEVAKRNTQKLKSERDAARLQLNKTKEQLEVTIGIQTKRLAKQAPTMESKPLIQTQGTAIMRLTEENIRDFLLPFARHLVTKSNKQCSGESEIIMLSEPALDFHLEVKDTPEGLNRDQITGLFQNNKKLLCFSEIDKTDPSNEGKVVEVRTVSNDMNDTSSPIEYDYSHEATNMLSHETEEKIVTTLSANLSTSLGAFGVGFEFGTSLQSQLETANRTIQEKSTTDNSNQKFLIQPGHGLRRLLYLTPTIQRKYMKVQLGGYVKLRFANDHIIKYDNGLLKLSEEKAHKKGGTKKKASRTIPIHELIQSGLSDDAAEWVKEIDAKPEKNSVSYTRVFDSVISISVSLRNVEYSLPKENTSTNQSQSDNVANVGLPQSEDIDINHQPNKEPRTKSLFFDRSKRTHSVAKEALTSKQQEPLSKIIELMDQSAQNNARSIQDRISQVKEAMNFYLSLSINDKNPEQIRAQSQTCWAKLSSAHTLLLSGEWVNDIKQQNEIINLLKQGKLTHVRYDGSEHQMAFGYSDTPVGSEPSEEHITDESNQPAFHQGR